MRRNGREHKGRRGQTGKPAFLSAWTALLLAVAVLGVLAGCGKKGPPVPPPRYRPPAVTDLTHRIDDQRLTLKWTIPAATGTRTPAVEGCVVYRARQSILEADCTGCPVPFEPVADIAVTQQSTPSGQPEASIYEETLLPGYSYTYKVVCYARGGEPGEDSNSVNFTLTRK